jgi:hypothetical protein
MKNHTRKALAEIRIQLGVRRLDPRRLFLVDDGAVRWIQDRSWLSIRDAHALRVVNAATECGAPIPAHINYDDVCRRVGCIASSCGSWGNWAALPESWRDGSALGPCTSFDQR